MQQQASVGTCCHSCELKEIGARQTPGGPPASYGRYVPSRDLVPMWLRFGPGWRRRWWGWPRAYLTPPLRWTVQARSLYSGRAPGYIGLGPAWVNVGLPTSRAGVCVLLQTLALDNEVSVRAWRGERLVLSHTGSLGAVRAELGCSVGIGNPDIYPWTVGIGNPDIFPWAAGIGNPDITPWPTYYGNRPGAVAWGGRLGPGSGRGRR